MVNLETISLVSYKSKISSIWKESTDFLEQAYIENNRGISIRICGGDTKKQLRMKLKQLNSTKKYTRPFLWRT